jgi:hypothetical protein
VYSFTLSTPVDASTSGVVTLTVKVNSALPAGLRSITNTAGSRTSTPGDDSSDNFAQDVDAFSTVPALALAVAFDSNTPYPTKVITYTARYTNTSAMDTTGVVITVTKSPYVTYVAPPNWIFAGGNVYTQSIGNLAAGASGSVTFVVSLPYTFTPEMISFANTFLIQDAGPGGLSVARASQAPTVGVPDLVVASVRLIPSTVKVGTKFTATVVISNAGTGVACNPKTTYLNPSAPCGPFALDAFTDPATPPPSNSFGGYGAGYTYIAPLGPGMTATAVIADLSFAANQNFILYFKVDNWNCAGDPLHPPCLPDTAQHGLVPESNESNNVFGPVRPLTPVSYLPLIVRGRVRGLRLVYMPLMSK